MNVMFATVPVPSPVELISNGKKLKSVTKRIALRILSQFRAPHVSNRFENVARATKISVRNC